MVGVRTILHGLWEIICPYEIHFGIEQQPERPLQESKMSRSITDLDACNDEQLKQLLAGLLTEAREQVLSDAEVQEFWRVYQEIQRRSGIAA